MTTLTLDHTQRLQLIAMLDRIESPGRREAWCVCALQQRLDLNDEERAIIGWRKQRTEDGREFVLWANGPMLPPKTYELEDDDVQRIVKAMDQCPVVLGRDKAWYLPLVEQLPPLPGEPSVEPIAVGGVYGGLNRPGSIHRSEAEIREQIAKNGG